LRQTRPISAILQDLIQKLPEDRAALLRQELVLLHRSAQRVFAEPEDRALAAISDSQGVGGKPQSALQPGSTDNSTETPPM
jgi:hypothetical protein